MTTTESTLLSSTALLMLGFILGETKTVLGNRSTQNKEAKDEAIKAYRTLMGMRTLIMQDVVSWHEAGLNTAYHQRKFSLAYKAKDALKDYEKYVDFQESKRWHQKREDLIDKLMEDFRIVVESCATLSVFFKDDEAVQKLVDDICEIKTFKIENLSDTKLNQLDDAWKNASANIQKMTSEHYTMPIKELLEAVKDKLF